MAEDTQGRVLYVRRRKQERPLCHLCRRPYFAGSTLRAITYYYPTCRCLVPSRKGLRRLAGVSDGS